MSYSTAGYAPSCLSLINPIQTSAPVSNYYIDTWLHGYWGTSVVSKTLSHVPQDMGSIANQLGMETR